MAKWLVKKNAGDLRGLMSSLGVGEVTAQVLVNRNIKTVEMGRAFLNPLDTPLRDVSLMSGVPFIFNTIKEAVAAGKSIVIYGDYDVDGVMSTVILYKALKRYGADISFYIPHREEEGYGMNITAVEELYKSGAEFIITCDNGISAIAEIARAKELGMGVAVIDHHEPGFVLDGEGGRSDILPEADVIVDVKQSRCAYPFKQLCAAGVCYKLMKAFYEFESLPFTDDDELLIFACMATFCDIVDLLDENRIIAQKGLTLMNGSVTNPGLAALIHERGLEGKQIGSFEIGFVLGPCINATGRLDSAVQAVNLFLTRDATEAVKLAKKLHELNEERKAMTSSSVERVMAGLQVSPHKDDDVLVIYDGEVHESIAGIVAGRIKDKLNHPVIVLTKGVEFVKGSARSIEGYNMFEALSACRDLFERFGGHAMAAGLSLREENIEPLRRRLQESSELTAEDFTEVVRLDKAVVLSDITYELAVELERLAPFGKENREPLFGVKSASVEAIRVIEEKGTMIFTFAVSGNYRKIKGICFGKVDKFRECLQEVYDSYNVQKIMNGVLRTADLKMDLAFYIEINEYNGNVSVQIRITDFRIVQSTPSE